MIEIKPCHLGELSLELRSLLAQCFVDGQPATRSVNSKAGDTPFVQVTYDEVPAEQIDRLFGFGGIPGANGPIGLHGDFSPTHLGHDPKTGILLFPLEGLERHLLAEEPEISRQLKDAGSMEVFADRRGDAMTAIEYFTAGVLTCIWFCKATGQALVITW